jgi:hypothetical protein
MGSNCRARQAGNHLEETAMYDETKLQPSKEIFRVAFQRPGHKLCHGCGHDSKEACYGN